MSVTDLSYLPQVCNTGIVQGADRVLGFSFAVDGVPYDLEGTDPLITITSRSVSVEKASDELWLGVKGQPNWEIAGFPRKIFRYRLA